MVNIMRVFSIVCLVLFSAVLITANASAASFTFGDSAKTWPDWTGTIGSDVYGTPNFTGGSGEINSSGFLSSISFNYTQESYASNPNIPLTAGSLFIDGNADGTWDYVVNTLGVDSADGAVIKNIYSVTLAENAAASNYILSQNSAIWGSLGVRSNHPVGVDPSLLAKKIGDANFSGWFETSGPHTSTFSFNSNLISLGNSFTVSWMPNCANDVVYATITNPVPEPGTFILLGSGLFAAAAMGRKLKFRK
jgi:hypothetical protein